MLLSFLSVPPYPALQYTLLFGRVVNDEQCLPSQPEGFSSLQVFSNIQSELFEYFILGTLNCANGA